MLSVRELLGDLDVRLLAGESNLDLPIRWVHMTELVDPTPWLSGGEVLLTTGMQLDTPARQREFVELLADHQIAGLGFGTGFGHEQVPEPLVQAALELEFPVFEVPYETAVHRDHRGRLLEARKRAVRRVAPRPVRPGAARARGPVGAWARGSGGDARDARRGERALFDARGELLVQHAFRRRLGTDELTILRDGVRERIGRRDHVQFMPGLEDPSRGLAIPVASEGGAGSGVPAPEAWLVAVKDDAPLSDFDRLALRQAVTIVALELLRERVAGDTERRLAGDVLAGLLAGELSGTDLQRRLEPFGLPGSVSVLALPKPGSAGNGNGRGPTSSWPRRRWPPRFAPRRRPRLSPPTVRSSR